MHFYRIEYPPGRIDELCRAIADCVSFVKAYPAEGYLIAGVTPQRKRQFCAHDLSEFAVFRMHTRADALPALRPWGHAPPHPTRPALHKSTSTPDHGKLPDLRIRGTPALTRSTSTSRTNNRRARPPQQNNAQCPTHSRQ